MSETTVVLTIIGGIAAPLLTYLGVRYTARSAGEVNRADQAGEERREVMDAWRALLEPMQKELARQRERTDELEKKVAAADKELGKQARLIRGLTEEVRRWKRTAHAIARWAMVLRDMLLRLDVDVPAAPEELVELHALGQDQGPWVTPPTD